MFERPNGLLFVSRWCASARPPLCVWVWLCFSFHFSFFFSVSHLSSVRRSVLDSCAINTTTRIVLSRMYPWNCCVSLCAFHVKCCSAFLNGFLYVMRWNAQFGRENGGSKTRQIFRVSLCALFCFSFAHTNHKCSRIVCFFIHVQMQIQNRAEQCDANNVHWENGAKESAQKLIVFGATELSAEQHRNDCTNDISTIGVVSKRNSFTELMMHAGIPIHNSVFQFVSLETSSCVPEIACHLRMYVSIICRNSIRAKNK